MCHEFKQGDIVIAKTNNGYGITTDGWQGKIVHDYRRTDYFKAESLDESESFDDLEIDKFYIIYKD